MDMTMRSVLGPLAILALSAAADRSCLRRLRRLAQDQYARGDRGDLQRSGCKSGDIATVTSLPADAAAPLIRKVCAFNQQIVVIPREPRPQGSLVHLLCVYAPR